MMSVYEQQYPELFLIIKENKLPLRYFPEERSFAIELRTGRIWQQISFCPWTGKRLPRPLSAEFEEELNALGLSRMQPERHPPHLRSEKWWLDRGL